MKLQQEIKPEVKSDYQLKDEAKWDMARKIVQLLIDDEYTIAEANEVFRRIPSVFEEKRFV